MKDAPFSRTALVLLFSCGIILLALSILLRASDNSPSGPRENSGAGSYSTSAIGHAGIYDILHRLGCTVTRSTGNAAAMAGSHGTIIMAEPDLSFINTDDNVLFTTVPRMLLVLPKWKGTPDEDKPAWIVQYSPVSQTYANQTLALVDARSTVTRREWPEEWRVNSLGIEPSMKPQPENPDAGPVVQLIRSSTIQPVVACKNGILVGEIYEDGQKIWILSDPDIMNNHGLGEGDNAAFMVALLDALRFWNNDAPGTPLVFDETVHGYTSAKTTPLKLLFRFPFSVFTFLVCITALLAVMAGAGRFGPPLKQERELDFGKRNLLANGARLLDYSGHHALILKRYTRMTIRTVAKALHAPQDLDEPALAAWLDAIGKERGVKFSCAQILADMDHTPDGDTVTNLSRLFTNAWNIHTWKGEILHGTGTEHNRHQ